MSPIIVHTISSSNSTNRLTSHSSRTRSFIIFLEFTSDDQYKQLFKTENRLVDDIINSNHLSIDSKHIICFSSIQWNKGYSITLHEERIMIVVDLILQKNYVYRFKTPSEGFKSIMMVTWFLSLLSQWWFRKPLRSCMDLSKTKATIPLLLFLQNCFYSLNSIIIYGKKHFETVTPKKSSREKSTNQGTTIEPGRNAQISVLPSLI